MLARALHNQPFLVAEDLSAIGTMSLGVAVPILAALGVPAAILPTQVLSTQTEGFGVPAKQYSASWVEKAMTHWQREKIQLSGGLIGYVGQIDLLSQLTQLVVSQQLRPLIVDPVMGDDGELYPGLSGTYVERMRELVTHAAVITPNWTEAQLLADQPITVRQPNQADIAAVFTALNKLVGEKAHIVITGIPSEGEIITAYQDDRRQRMIATKLRPGHFYGSGDVFSALLSATLVRGVTLDAAVKLAVKGDTISLDQTSEAGYQRRFGMQLSRLLAWLAQDVVPELGLSN